MREFQKKLLWNSHYVVDFARRAGLQGLLRSDWEGVELWYEVATEEIDNKTKEWKSEH